MIGKTKGNPKVDQNLERMSLATTLISKGIFRESVENTRGIRIRVVERKKRQSITVVALDDEVMIAYDDECINLTCQESSWIIDSATSYYVTS